MKNIQNYETSNRELPQKATIGMAIRYAESVPDVLSAFIDTKSKLMEEITANPDEYKIDKLGDNPMEGNKIKSCFSIMEKKFVGNTPVVNCIRQKCDISSKYADILKSIHFLNTPSKTGISCDIEGVTDVYLNIPRGTNVTLSRITNTKDTIYFVQNAYNSYETEGFTFAIHFDHFRLALRTAAVAGIKGAGDLTLYLWTDTEIWVDSASKYMDIQPVLERFKG